MKKTFKMSKPMSNYVDGIMLSNESSRNIQLLPKTYDDYEQTWEKVVKSLPKFDEAFNHVISEDQYYYDNLKKVTRRLLNANTKIANDWGKISVDLNRAIIKYTDEYACSK